MNFSFLYFDKFVWEPSFPLSLQQILVYFFKLDVCFKLACFSVRLLSFLSTKSSKWPAAAATRKLSLFPTPAWSFHGEMVTLENLGEEDLMAAPSLTTLKD